MPEIFTAPKRSSSAHKYNINPTDPTKKGHIVKKKVTLSNYNIFSSLVQNPIEFGFTDQADGENILLFTRRHFATNIPWIIITFLGLIFPFMLPLFLWIINFPYPALPLPTIFVLICLYYLVIFGYALLNYIDWFYNIGIITERRLIDIDFLRLSYIDLAITQLPEIEDVVQRQKGFFASFFNYGDVVAHTVASITGKEDFVFEHIPYPSRVVDIISNLLGDK